MPIPKLDSKLKEMRRQTSLSFIEIRELALVTYVADYDFEAARHDEAMNRKRLIRYAVKKYGDGAKKVLYKMRTPILPEELKFYEQALIDRWNKKHTKIPIKQPLSLNNEL